eukprot:2031535-Rhodomonas_salina.1
MAMVSAVGVAHDREPTPATFTPNPLSISTAHRTQHIAHCTPRARQHGPTRPRSLASTGTSTCSADRERETDWVVVSLLLLCPEGDLAGGALADALCEEDEA